MKKYYKTLACVIEKYYLCGSKRDNRYGKNT